MRYTKRSVMRMPFRTPSSLMENHPKDTRGVPCVVSTWMSSVKTRMSHRGFTAFATILTGTPETAMLPRMNAVTSR